jgi:hypothetical protein
MSTAEEPQFIRQLPNWENRVVLLWSYMGYEFHSMRVGHGSGIGVTCMAQFIPGDWQDKTPDDRGVIRDAVREKARVLHMALD